MDLTGKTAVITGAAGGIGRAAVAEFVAGGARVVALDIDETGLNTTALLASEYGAVVTTVIADVSKENSVAAAVAAAEDALGHIDVLYNNAGIQRHGYLHELSPADFDLEWAVNVRSVFLMMRAVLPSMYARRSGCVINTSSVNGWVGNAGDASYAATKHAVIGLTKAVAAEAGPFGVRVNALCPGPTRTPMFDGFASPEAQDELARKLVPLGRTADPAEQARVARFLASDAASFVTGTAVLVDGGLVNAVMT